MLEKIGRRFEALVRQWMPDPFVLAIMLTVLVFILALFLSDNSFEDLAGMWFNGAKSVEAKSGFWALLEFSMQMVLIVVTGEALAAAPQIQRLLKMLANFPKTARGAVIFVSAVAMALGWLHWGFGLIAAALMAREVAAQFKRRGVPVHYPLLGAAAYTAQLIWHGGLSGSAPLVVNSPKHFLYEQIGQIGFDQTVLTPMNLTACFVLWATVPFLLGAMSPKIDNCDSAPDAEEDEVRAPTTPTVGPTTFAARIDALPLWSWTVAALGIFVMFVSVIRNKGFEINPNSVNFCALLLGMALHRSPGAYMKIAARSMKGATGIVVQFPFYGGIMGVMLGSGLGHKIAGIFIQFASAHSLPFYTYTASVLSKLFIPSGGGEWAVEGPVMLKAAKALGADTGKTIMAVAYGNMVGNMFQPFWALPLLGIMNLKASEIMGYCLVIFCFACPLLGAILLIFS